MSFGLAGKTAQQVNLKMCGKYFSPGRELWLSKMLSPRSLDRAKQSRFKLNYLSNAHNVFTKQILLQPNYLSNVSWANFRLTWLFSYGLQASLPEIVLVWILYLLFLCVCIVHLYVYLVMENVLWITCSVPGTCWISDRDLKLAIHYADFGEKKSFCSHALIKIT